MTKEYTINFLGYANSKNQDGAIDLRACLQLTVYGKKIECIGTSSTSMAYHLSGWKNQTTSEAICYS